MMQPACPETRAAARPATFPWLATLMIGTAIAAFAPAVSAQTATEPAAEAPAAEATDDAAASGDTGAPAAEATTDAAPAEASPAGDAAAAGDFRQAGGAIVNADGTEIGSVIITETASGVIHFILDLGEGSVPAAQHAIHIHETGACEAPTFESAGGHLAADKEHGIHSANGIHPGDLPNITMGQAGALHVEYFMPGVLLDDILDDDGSAVVIHSDVDDYTTQPAGNAGDRIACGVLALSS